MPQRIDRAVACSLLTHGFFHDRLIPPFKSDGIEPALDEMLRVAAADGKRDRNDRFRLPFRSKCSRHSVPKQSYSRRTLSIPNPRIQTLVVAEVSRYWESLRKFCERSSISLTTPVHMASDTGSFRAFESKYPRNQVAHQRALRSIGKRYLLQTDIARFYASIYTHSIPWALHGKTKAKKDGTRNRFYGSRLDLWVRESQDKQTGGIPIGPDTSFLLAEVVACAIDAELQRSVRKPLCGTRFIDDYHLYFDSLAEAEGALAALHRAAALFELEVNDSKTEIVELPESLEPAWKTQLRMIAIKDDGDAAALKALFDLGFQLSRAFPNDNVLTYVAKKVSSAIPLNQRNWEVCEPLLLRSCFREPGALPTVLSIYEQQNDRNHERLTTLIESLCLYHGSLHQGYEVAWGLWLAKNLNVHLSNRVGQVIGRIDDDIVALTALDLQESGLMQIGDTSLWEQYTAAEHLYSEHWLLAYEATEQGWLGARGGDYVGADEFYSILQRHQVRFYDTGAEWDEGGYSEFGYNADDESDDAEDEDAEDEDAGDEDDNEAE